SRRTGATRATSSDSSSARWRAPSACASTTTSPSPTTSESPRSSPRRAGSRRSPAPSGGSRSWRPTTAWKSLSEPSGLSTMHWSERRWVRVLCGSRGQPLGIGLLGLLLVVVFVPELFGLGFIRLAAFDAYQRWAPRTRHSAPAVILAIDEENRRHHASWPW